MKVLFITNSSTERCGVRVFGELWMQALRRVGVEVEEWDGTYSAIQARGGQYLPSTDGFDLVHLNWDPQAINHYLPQHFRGGPPLSLFLHDVPPNSTCPVAQRAKVVFSHERYGRWVMIRPDGSVEGAQRVVQIDHAVPDHVPNCYTFDKTAENPIGITGIREDAGNRMVLDICKRHGWPVSVPYWWPESTVPHKLWTSTEQEINRLSNCLFNVCWYETSGRGKSMAAMFCVAARRPLLLSGSSMFSVLAGRPDVYQVETHWGSKVLPEYSELERWMEMLREEALAGRAKVPAVTALELRWSKLALKIKAAWEGVIR